MTIALRYLCFDCRLSLSETCAAFRRRPGVSIFCAVMSVSVTLRIARSISERDEAECITKLSDAAEDGL